MNETRVETVVFGAGIVGTCTALELARRGKSVLLLDRREPGRETSYGNLGIIAVGSNTPMNNAGLWADMPEILGNRSTYIRYSLPYLLRNPGWVLNFLAGARRGSASRRAAAWHPLLEKGRERHRALSEEAAETVRVRRDGWFHLCRDASAPTKLAEKIAIMKRCNVEHEVVDAARIAELEPALAGKFLSGVWVKDADTVDDPGAMVEAYAGVLKKLGGQVRQASVQSLAETADGWIVETESGPVEADNVVVALGPWSRNLLGGIGIKLPMMHERGSHREFVIPGDKPALTRPVYDIDGGYGISPMAGRYRITSGVYLMDQDEPMGPVQLDLVEPLARQVMPIGQRTNTPDWFGARPTFADCLPAIGPMARRGLWLATGHQHLGFSTGPSTGELLAQMMCGETPGIDPTPFLPSRFGL
ncbi:MAG: FAD-dependent oxidoreductase [Alphaproteobacteria bacterium]